MPKDLHQKIKGEYYSYFDTVKLEKLVLTKMCIRDRDISLDEKTAVEGISIPFHKGAAEYYKECGIDVKTEKGNN